MNIDFMSNVDFEELAKEKVKELKDMQEQAKMFNKEITQIKNDLRYEMTRREIKKINGVIQIQYPKSFDYGLFKMEFPDLTKRYFTEETITTMRDVFDKKLIKKECPEEYKKCEVELTPRLIIK